METRRLQYFVQIVDAGSINRAAVAIGIAQPALSQQLAILENELKVRLLDRSPSGVTPTEAGRKLYVRAQVILRQVGSLKLELTETAEAVAGVVALGLPPSLGASIGGPLVARVRTEHPFIRLQVAEDGAGALTGKLLSGLLDMSLSSVRVSDAALEGQALLAEDLFLVSARPVSGSLAEIAALPWIVSGAQNAIRGHLGAIFTQADLEPNIVAEINSLPMVIHAVEQGLGVTLLPRQAVEESLAAGRVAISSFTDPAPRRTVYLYRRRDKATTPAEDAVWRLVLEVSRALTAQDGYAEPRQGAEAAHRMGVVSPPVSLGPPK